MNSIRMQLLTMLLCVAFLVTVSKTPEWFDSIPRIERTPHCADELLDMQTVNLPIDTVNKYIEQITNYGKGSFINSFELGDALQAYDAYGVYDTGSVSILYYKVSYSDHEEIKVALNPFVARFPSTLPLYWREVDGDSLPSKLFNYADGIFTLTSQTRYFDFVRIITQQYSVDTLSNRFNRQNHAEKLVGINDYEAD